MSLQTNFQGRLRNTHLPVKHGLMPLFEAVVNSIHSIEDRGQNGVRGQITVQIERSSQKSLDFDDADSERDREAIVAFKIVDDGIGFTDANMNSFRTLDSDHKAAKGGRGVGRLLWLKAFHRVAVTSVFCDSEGQMKERRFTFDAKNGISVESLRDVNDEKQQGTTVSLEGFVERFREPAYKTLTAISNSLLEHCLWYFVRPGGLPEIVVIDNNGQAVSLDILFQDYMVASAVNERIRIKSCEFQITHTKLRATQHRSHAIALCAANRLVTEERISGKLPGLFGRLSDGQSEFVYVCYVASPYLDEHVRPERTDFEIAENVGLFGDSEISLTEISTAVLSRTAEHLKHYLEEKQRAVQQRVQTFVEQKAPRYRPILPRIALESMSIDPNASDRELELSLHKELTSIEAKLLSDGHDLMRPTAMDDLTEYDKRLQDYLQTAEDIKKSDLANYVFHRKVILDLLGAAIQRDDSGRYVREDRIHKLIMPMRVESNQVQPQDCNLWLIDERLSFHNYLASDKTLNAMPITDSDSTKEPDLAVLNIFDNAFLVSEGSGLPLASIVIIEIKRPMRDDAASGEDKDPIEQALGYLNRIRNGKVRTANGRLIPDCENIPGYCYVLCDITDSIAARCQMHDAVRTSDGMGYFFFHKTFKAYVEVSSFDRLLNAARQRNRAFFDQLGLPTN